MGAKDSRSKCFESVPPFIDVIDERVDHIFANVRIFRTLQSAPPASLPRDIKSRESEWGSFL